MQRGLAGRVVEFAGFLKTQGFRVFQSSIHDALCSLQEIPLHQKRDFFASLRSNLVTTDLEWKQFPDLFEQFWSRFDIQDEKPPGHPTEQGKETEQGESEDESVSEISRGRRTEANKDDTKEVLEGVVYSPVTIVEKKDLCRFSKADIQVAQLALKKMIEPFRINMSRRSRRTSKASELDFGRVIRRSLKTGGIPVDLFYKEKKKRLKRLVILADVSGSMDRYARFVMPFLLGLRGIGSRAEVFVFATSLTSITFMVRHLSVENALERIAEEVPDWSGGTRIGYSLHQFNQGPGQRLLSGRTVLVFLSDGWDLGGKELLKREMEVLSRKAYSIIWLNPLAGDPDYQPLCQGMKVALPYVDHFLPADTLESLKRVGRLLSRVMMH